MVRTVLLVEDDRPLAELLRDYLNEHDLEVTIESHGNRAFQKIVDEQPDLVILDLMLPGEDGLSICKRVRPLYRGLIMMLTARGDDDAEVTGLDIGADDYVAKPVKARVLLSRIRALSRRAAPANTGTSAGEAAGTITAGELRMIASSRRAWMRGESLDLTAAEFDLLWLLASNAGKILSRETLLNDETYDGIDRSVDVRISKLRQKIGDDPRKPNIIKTIRGVGYIYSV